MIKGYKSEIQTKNIAWLLPRPKPDHYKGGMPLYCEEWLIALAKDILKTNSITILNLFCGMNKYGLRVDIKKEVKPDICCDVHEIHKHVSNKYDLIIADPPYSNEEAEKIYNTPKLSYIKWTKSALKLLKNGGLFCIYHKYLMPNPDPNKLHIIKRVFIGSRAYHLARIALFFKKGG